MKTIISVLICVIAPSWLRADVADSSAGGFTVKVTLNVQAAPDDVYHKLVGNIGEWWDSAHTFSGSSRNLMIDDKPMGCFCEKLANGGGVRHMEVVRVEPGKTLVMIGALGPMQAMAAAGSMTISFTPANGATKLEVTYAVTGYRPEGFKDFAPVVDKMITGQFVRLKSFVERGNP